MFSRKLFGASWLLYRVWLLALEIEDNKAIGGVTEANETDSLPISIMDSGVEEVDKFDTVIIFYIQVESHMSSIVNISIVPQTCCLIVDVNDIVCGQILVLRPTVIMHLDIHNPAQEAKFLFRNKYATNRRGNCTFQIAPQNMSADWNLTHVITFDTYPEAYDKTIMGCNGIDLDPDRSCTPVDCAIKYEGLRNFFRNITNRCEVVVDCDTRGPDGISTIAYYDWEDNQCVPLAEDVVTMEEFDDDSLIHIESEKELHTPDIEPSRSEQLMKSGKLKLRCNHGFQSDQICQCHNGWMSSGVRESSLLEFNWCDIEVSSLGYFSGEPRRLSKEVEMVAIFLLSCLELFLVLLWFILAYILIKESLPKGIYKSKPANYGRLEEVIPHSLK